MAISHDRHCWTLPKRSSCGRAYDTTATRPAGAGPRPSKDPLKPAQQARARADRPPSPIRNIDAPYHTRTSRLPPRRPSANRRLCRPGPRVARPSRYAAAKTGIRAPGPCLAPRRHPQSALGAARRPAARGCRTPARPAARRPATRGCRAPARPAAAGTGSTAIGAGRTGPAAIGASAARGPRRRRRP